MRKSFMEVLTTGQGVANYLKLPKSSVVIKADVGEDCRGADEFFKGKLFQSLTTS